MIYYIIREEISMALHTLYLLQEKEDLLTQLKNSVEVIQKLNQELKALSLNDELTGLYNRRGFMTIGEEIHKTNIRERKGYVLFFSDLDGLKQINDRYGHKAGDHAIRQISIILKKVFRNNDIISRLGGDEFAILANSDKIKLPLIKKRIEDHLDKYNQNSDKPYNISISIGFVNFDPDKELSFTEMLEFADKNLYEMKKSKIKIIHKNEHP